MHPQLLPKGQLNIESIDYTQGFITRHYISGDSRYYFTLHPELYPDGDALSLTGRYFAVLLGPKGLKAFYMAPDGSGNYLIDYDVNNDVTPQQKLQNLDGFISEFASALKNEINQQVNELSEYIKMLNQALQESKVNN